MTSVPVLPIAELAIRAGSAEDAHGQLGQALGDPIRAVVHARMAATAELEFAAQIRAIRGSERQLRACTAEAPSALSQALTDYRASLSAWARGAELERALPAMHVDGAPISVDDLALWLQDDNTGCQTGLLRLQDGSVVLFHTEEDTIGYFDRARVVHMDVAGVRRSAFLYPYLLPGPAFGFHERGAFAYDTLNLQRTEAGGTPTSTFSWLAWWACGALPLQGTAEALMPFLDGGALAVVGRDANGVHGEQVEVGGTCAQHRELASGRTHQVQVNMVAEPGGGLRALELYDAEGRAPYIARLARAERLLHALGGELDVPALAQMLASREGESWAFANDDVVAHFIAHVTRSGLTVYAGAGPCRGDARFDAVWSM